jgi:hypothetical protein
VSEHGTTGVSAVLGLSGDASPSSCRERVGLAHTAHAIARLAQARDRLWHLSTVEQVRAMAWFDGREPCSYLLAPSATTCPNCRSAARIRLGDTG